MPIEFRGFRSGPLGAFRSRVWIQTPFFCRTTRDRPSRRLSVPAMPDFQLLGDTVRVKVRVQVQRVNQAAVNFDQFGIDADALPISGDRVVELPGVAQGSAEIALSFGQIRPQRDRPAASRDRFIQPPGVS